MKKIFLILLFFIGSAINSCMGASTFTHQLETVSPAAAQIYPINPSAAQGTIEPETGTLSGLQAGFLILTNTPISSDFILTGSVETTTSTENSFLQSGTTPYVILGNTTNVPTIDSITNIKTSPTLSGNPNAIAYPLSTAVTTFNSLNFVDNPTYGGYCFQLDTGVHFLGTATLIVNATTPLANTYSIGTDTAGTYQSIITMTAYSNP